ncbi:MAG TPA: butyrate kinase [bacterium]|nr:butyrate kinase [bacterium]HPS29244.1 butyrate kinase [bacterium]
MKILVINPGSTSTKIAIFEDTKELMTKNIKHSVQDLAGFTRIFEQYDLRKETILNEIKNAGFDIKSFGAVVGRGGLLKPIRGGVYKVNDLMIEDLKIAKMGEHACNLGAPIAREIAIAAGENVQAYIVDPVVVDEMEGIARFSGIPEISRLSIFHALNQKAVARRYARERGKKYEDFNFIIAHLGGGVSVGAHKKGRVIDVNNALNGEGPFSPERSGGLPAGQLVKMCFSGKYTGEEINKKLKGNGGLVAYLGTNSAYEVEKRVLAGEHEAEIVYKAMAYQVSKEIGALSAVLEGKVDAIILTGGVAYDKLFVSWVKEKVSFIAEVITYPGEDEMQALADGCFYGLKGEIAVRDYE